MGIIYSAVKSNKPEAWEIGKNYYRLEELFPACRFNVNILTLRKDVKPDSPSALKFAAINALAAMVPPRWEPGKPDPFVLSELYPTVEDMFSKMEELTGEKLTQFEEPHWREFYKWADVDPIMIIGDFEGWTDPEEPEKFCGPTSDYRWMDSWNGEAGRRVGAGFEEDEEE